MAKEFTKEQLIKNRLTQLTESKSNIKSDLKKAYQALKKLKTTLVGHKSGEDSLSFSDLKKIKTAARQIEDIYEDMMDEEMVDKAEKEKSEVEESTISDNEQSEGHGEMFNALKGVNENVIKISQDTLKNVVRRVIEEQKKDK